MKEVQFGKVVGEVLNVYGFRFDPPSPTPELAEWDADAAYLSEKNAPDKVKKILQKYGLTVEQFMDTLVARTSVNWIRKHGLYDVDLGLPQDFSGLAM
jgi:hypothetical protein